MDNQNLKKKLKTKNHQSLIPIFIVPHVKIGAPFFSQKSDSSKTKKKTKQNKTSF